MRTFEPLLLRAEFGAPGAEIAAGSPPEEVWPENELCAATGFLDLSRDPPKNAEFPARTALAGPDMVCF